MKQQFHYGLGTHFNAWVDPQRLAQIATRFTSARIDAQTSSPELARQMIADVEAADLHPIVIIDTPEQQEALPDGGWVELQNEVNIGLGRPAPLSPAQYRANIEWAYAIAKRKGQTLCAGAAANMERRDIEWFLNLGFKDLPVDIVAVTHHYVPRDRFWQAHIINRWNPSTWTRQYEVDCFRAAIGLDRNWMITEWGYGSGPHSSLTPEEAAGEEAQEWPFWLSQERCLGAWRYQIGDSPIDDHDFGLYDEYGQIKQAIFETVPLRQEIVMANSEVVIYEECLIPLDSYGKPGKFSAYTNPKKTHVIGMDENGTVYANPLSEIGTAFSTFALSADRLVGVFVETGSPLHRGLPVRKFHAAA